MITDQAAVRRPADSQTQFRVTFETAPIGLAHVGPEGRVLRGQPSGVPHLGCGAGELTIELLQLTTKSLRRHHLLGRSRRRYCTFRANARGEDRPLWRGESLPAQERCDGVVRDFLDHYRRPLNLNSRGAEVRNSAAINSNILDPRQPGTAAHSQGSYPVVK